MNSKIIIISGDPNSINSEIIFKAWKEVSKLKSIYLPLIIFLLNSLSPVAFEPLIIR